MTYHEAIAFWYGRINYEVRSAKPADLKLERMQTLLSMLGDPHDQLRIVHVTGTKGKGSTCAMLASVLQHAGFRVGLFTSPHLTHVEERMQVNGVPIAHAELAALMDDLAPAVHRMEANPVVPPPTFFEIGTALGFLHFLRRRCEVAIVEVGLGGRFDSTNVCRPMVSVVTNIGLDHTAQLGETVEAIAYQKAGIIKRSVPVVSGVAQAGARAVVRAVAKEMDAPLWEVDDLGEGPQPAVALPGAHQIQNARVAMCVLERLREAGMPIPDAAVANGLAEVKWPARIERISEQPTVILDTAHNVPSAEALVHTLRESFPVSGAKHVIFAVSSDKPVADILRILADYFDYFHLTKYSNNPRCVAVDKLVSVLNSVAPQKRFNTYSTSVEAWHGAREAANSEALICVTGSVFLAGELRPLLCPHEAT